LEVSIRQQAVQYPATLPRKVVAEGFITAYMLCFNNAILEYQFFSPP
jgi:hypothetical protein